MTAQVQNLLPPVTRMLPRDMQETNEYRFARKHIDRFIHAEITNSVELMARVDDGVARLKAWMSQSYYKSKDARLVQLKPLDLHQLVLDIFVGVAYITEPVLFTSVSGQLAGRLRFDDKLESIKTLSEILAVLALTDVFDVTKQASQVGSLLIHSRIQLSDKLMAYIENSQYLPPMVCPPELVTNNRQSGYLTFNDSVLLRSYNHHDGDICLDVVNLQNQIPLTLNVEFLRTVEEVPNKDIEFVDPDLGLNSFEAAQLVRDRKDQWNRFRDQSREVYALLIGQGNEFYETHKYDKRGRIYAQGYHVSTMGTKYKKAMIELAEKEIIDGVPE